MTPFDRFLLQADSFVIAVVLIVYLFKAMNKGSDANKGAEIKTASAVSTDMARKKIPIVKTAPLKTGSTKGEAETSGIDDDETACAILAAVSTASMIPLNTLKIKSIRVIDK